MSFNEGAEAVTALERSVKKLADALGDAAPVEAKVISKQFDGALADQERRAMKSIVQLRSLSSRPGTRRNRSSKRSSVNGVRLPTFRSDRS